MQNTPPSNWIQVFAAVPTFTQCRCPSEYWVWCLHPPGQVRCLRPSVTQMTCNTQTHKTIQNVGFKDKTILRWTLRFIRARMLRAAGSVFTVRRSSLNCHHTRRCSCCTMRAHISCIFCLRNIIQHISNIARPGNPQLSSHDAAARAAQCAHWIFCLRNMVISFNIYLT